MKSLIPLFLILIYSQNGFAQTNSQQAISKSTISNNGPTIIGNGNNIILHEEKQKATNDSLEKKVQEIFAQDSSKYKVLIFPFKQLTHNGPCTKDYGQQVYEELSEINEQDNLGIIPGWLTEDYSISPFYTTDSFEKKGKEMHADFILYGNYDKVCGSDSGEVCVKYITFLYHLKQTENKETKVSDIDFSKGSLISDVKGILYSIVSTKYAHKDFRKYIYYSDKAISFGKEQNQSIDYDLRTFWVGHYRDSDYYSFNTFKNDIAHFKAQHIQDTGIARANFYSQIGDDYMSYAMYDSALPYLSRGSRTLEKLLFCELKLNLDLDVDATIRYWLPKIPRDTGNSFNLPIKIQLQYYQAILALRQQDYTKSLGIIDSIEAFLKPANPNLDFYVDLNTYYPPYLRTIVKAFIEIKLKNYSTAYNLLHIADSLNNFHVANNNLGASSRQIEYESWSNRYDNPICHYISDDNYHLMFNGLYYRLVYAANALYDNLPEAYSSCNYYINSVPLIVKQMVNKKAEPWPHFTADDIVKVSIEDYYNRALIAYKLGYFDSSAKDIGQCLSMSSKFNPAILLLYQLNKKGYGKNLLKQFRLYAHKSSSDDLEYSFNDWHW